MIPFWQMRALRLTCDKKCGKSIGRICARFDFLLWKERRIWSWGLRYSAVFFDVLRSIFTKSSKLGSSVVGSHPPSTLRASVGLSPHARGSLSSQAGTDSWAPIEVTISWKKKAWHFACSFSWPFIQWIPVHQFLCQLRIARVPSMSILLGTW